MPTIRTTFSAFTLAVAAGSALAAANLQPARLGPEGRQDRHARALERFDADADGELSAAERDAARRAFRERVRDRVTDRFDADGDGELSEAEHEAARAFHRARMDERRERVLTGLQRRGLEGLPPHVAEALAEFDINQNLTIDDDERVLLEMEIDARLEAKRAEMLARFDADADGELSTAEREAARGARRAEHEARRAEMVEKYDADGDGALGRDELETLRAGEGPPPRDPLLELLRPRRGPGAMRGRGARDGAFPARRGADAPRRGFERDI